MAKLKTKQTNESVQDFINSLENEVQRKDCAILLQIMQEVTKENPAMWGNMIGFGSYHYKYESGHEGDSFKMGFAPRKGKLTLYVVSYFDDNKEVLDILSRLGKHKTSKGCIYINKLSDVNLDVLKELVQYACDSKKNER